MSKGAWTRFKMAPPFRHHWKGAHFPYMRRNFKEKQLLGFGSFVPFCQFCWTSRILFSWRNSFSRDRNSFFSSDSSMSKQSKHEWLITGGTVCILSPLCLLARSPHFIHVISFLSGKKKVNLPWLCVQQCTVEACKCVIASDPRWNALIEIVAI